MFYNIYIYNCIIDQITVALVSKIFLSQTLKAFYLRAGPQCRYGVHSAPSVGAKVTLYEP